MTPTGPKSQTPRMKQEFPLASTVFWSSLQGVKKDGIKIKPTHPLQWILDSLSDHPAFFERRMFGMKAGYYADRIMLVVGDGEEPWNGLLLATDREHHPSLLEEWPDLAPHPILGKWLYLSQAHPRFEGVVEEIIAAARRGDPRVGTIPKPKSPRKSQKPKKAGTSRRK